MLYQWRRTLGFVYVCMFISSMVKCVYIESLQLLLKFIILGHSAKFLLRLDLLNTVLGVVVHFSGNDKLDRRRGRKI